MTFLDDRPPTRGLDLAFFPETGNIIGGSITDNQGGGGTFTESVGSDIPCRIDALGGDEGEIAERLSDRTTHIVTVIGDTEIDTANDFAIDGRGTFEVTAVREHSGDFTLPFEVVPR